MSFDNQQRVGAIFALAAYVSWGMFPLFYSLLTAVAPLEMLVHRVLMTALTLLPILIVFRLLPSLRALRQDPRNLTLLALGALMIGINWYVFMWAVVNERVIETSMGYFINPLITVLLGVVVLRERLRPAQIVSVLLAAAGVGYLVYSAGSLPWVALVLPLVFGSYGLIHKKLTVNPFTALFVEVLFLVPAALIYALYSVSEGTMQVISGTPSIKLLLFLIGPTTVIPLVLFSAATTRITLTTMGLLQYLTPTLSFITGVFILHEALDGTRLISFVIIWISLIVFALESLYQSRLTLRTATETV